MIDFLAAHYVWLKALHIIAVIYWMAGMLYLPRLFVYHHQAEPGGELETALLKQEHNLLRIIVNPAMIAVWTLAILMLIANPTLLSTGWFHAKLLLVVILSGIHGVYAGARRRFARGERPRTERFWRIMNEAPAVMVIVIVLLAVLKPFA
ncbi:protoporphyrinogen oxidase HemJ [Marinicauda salina]|jgi:putative membrane protein|uniref:Protoporphyrinogen IX oxidase n=1 Tax=Marinicauda salina TaxID=2135793 RepID=A0A2U2BWG1_9PROT|nr:protoporphyrinogen oxidase HemJ [Marinicauda salina]PWE18358.1 protoporphyrinogen oxidase HemJ [Marinicauda salina]